MTSSLPQVISMSSVRILDTEQTKAAECSIIFFTPYSAISFVMTRSIFSRSLGCSEEPRMKLCYPQVNHYPNAQWNNFATGRAFCAGGGDVSAVVNYVSNFELFQNYSVHGRFRIAIENTVFDVHVDDSQESFFGLTGARLDGAGMLACGLATQYVFSTWQPWRLEEMKDSMVERGRSKASTKGKLACFSNGGKAVKWRR
ncbi:hypothetical protein DY000_02011848 [Brassica cretica]|uniref:3-hydroxyisobutyryl-CoA hydrolase n=1 Tax=Brassica cretica TaxID=69181 RepID=A0ABQ7CWF9_BRACR|nr:hypothetical protein DY000_02011848 [Brassica cretica]